jgi:hypothetical protein
MAPRIELEDQTPTENTQVHGADIQFQQFGAQYKAAAQAGEGIEGLGLQLMNKRKEANDANYAFNSSFKYAQDYQKESENFQQNSPLGMDGYAANMSKFSTDYYDQVMKNAPSDDARRIFDQYGRRTMMDNAIGADKFEFVEKAKKQQADISTNGDELSKSLMDHPDYNTFADRLNILKGQINAGVGTAYESQEQANADTKKASNQAAVGLMEGLISQGRYGEGLMVLKDGQPVGDAIDPKEKAHYLEHLKGLVKTDQDTRVSTAMSQLDDVTYQATHGKRVDAGYAAQAAQTIQNSRMDPDKKARALDDLHTALTVGNDTSRLGTLPMSEWSKLPSANPQNSDWNSAKRGKIQDSFNAVAESFAKDRENDPVQSVLDNFPVLGNKAQQAQGGDPGVMQDYLDQVVSKQKYLQVQNPKVLSNQQAQQMGDMINKAPNPEAAAAAITGMQQSFGKYFSQAFNELAEKSSKGGAGVNPNLALAAYMPDQGSRQRVIENVLNAKNITDLYEARTTGTDVSFLEDAVKGKTKTITDILDAATPDGSNAALGKSISNQINIEAQKLLIDPANSQLRPRDAADQAYKNIVDQNFYTPKGGASTVLVPKTYTTVDGQGNQANLPNNPDLIKAALTHYSTPEGIASLNPKLDDNIVKSFYGDKSAAKEYTVNVLKDHARWVNTPDNSGIRLVAPNGDHMEPILDSKGNKIDMKFQDISTRPDPNVQGVNKQLKAGYMGTPNGY